jgi:O-antigen ligase
VVGQVWLIGQLAIGAFLIVSMSVELARRPILVVYGLLGLYAWSLVQTGELVSTRIAGFNVSVIDVANMIVFGATLIRLRRGPHGWQWALLAAVALTIYAALRGAISLGDAALLGFRAELYFLLPALFVSTLPRSIIPRVLRGTVLLGVALAVVAVARWIGLTIGLAPQVSGGVYAIERVINAQAALWVSLAAIAGWSAMLQKTLVERRWMTWLVTGLTLAVVLFSQHRSVWVATLIMLAVALVGTRRRWFTKAAIVIVAAVGVLSIASLGLDDVGVVGDSLAAAASNVGTWEWRQQRWVDVWATHAARGVQAIVFGTGYGYSWVSGAVGVWEVSPHNGYVQIAVRLGLLGAVLVFLPHLAILARLWSTTAPGGRVFWLWIVGTLVFYIPYSATPLTGVVLGASLAMLPAGRAHAAVDEALEPTATWYGRSSPATGVSLAGNPSRRHRPS